MATARQTGETAGDARRLAAALAEVADWEALLELAQDHGMIMLLRARLNEAGAATPDGPAVVPPAVSARLRRMAQGNAAHSLRLAHLLVTILERFDEADIAAMPMRGPVLAETVYGDLAMRQFHDLDVLVRPHRVEEAISLLSALDLRPHGDQPPLDPALRLRVRYDQRFFEPQSNAVVELHWGTGLRSQPGVVPAERLWESARTVAFMGRTVLQPSSGAQFLDLCVHGAKHRWARLESVVTLGRYVERHREMDLGRVLDDAGRLGCRRSCLLALALARDVLGLEVPPTIAARAEGDAQLASLVAATRAALLSSAFSHRSILDTMRWNAAVLDTPRQAAAYCLGEVLRPSPKDRAAFRLPPALEPAYYLLRPLRLATLPLSHLRDHRRASSSDVQ